MSDTIKQTETISEHRHRYASPFESLCPECSKANQAVRNKQNALLCAAINEGLPKVYARDLFIDCEVLAERNPLVFGSLLRECGTHIVYDAQSAEGGIFWLDKQEREAFYIYRGTLDKWGYEDGKLLKVGVTEWLQFCNALKGGGDVPIP